jgi:cobalamin biosynthesis Mg chelatase CobN
VLNAAIRFCLDYRVTEHAVRFAQKQEESHMSSDQQSRQTSPQDLHGAQGSTAGRQDNRDVTSRAGEAAKTIRDIGETVAAQVGTTASGLADKGSELATSAREQAKTFASELEAMARRNPLGTIVGALLVGVVIGMMSRGRG